MSIRSTLTSGLLAGSLFATPSFADITGAEVWADWKAYMEGFGYGVSATEATSGDTLTVTDLSMTAVIPEEDGSVTITFGSMTFTDQSDGTVSVGLPESMPITFEATNDGSGLASGTVLLTQTEPTMTVSGSAESAVCSYAAKTATMTLSDLVAEGEPIPAEMMSFEFTATDLANITRMTLGDLRSYEQTMTIGALSYDFSFDAPDDGNESGVFRGGATGLTSSSTMSIPSDMDPNDMNAMIDAGFAVEGDFKSQGGNSTFEVSSPDGDLSGSTSSDGAEFGFAMGPDGLAYNVAQNGLSIDTQVPDFPFPVSAEIARSALNFRMPLQASDEPQDFAFGFAFEDFTVADVIWNLFDPAVQLPRDPATIAIDLTGAAKLLADIMDPEVAENMGANEVPGELDSLNVNDITISAAGANAKAQGAYNFDNSDLETFDGFPRPEGALDVRIEGANGLIDTLVSMGLLPEDQAMGARMMMGLFAVPQGDDVLTSKIEVNSEGHVLANGQRLR